MDEILIRLGTSQDLIEFATTPGRAFILLAQLQLALRHPHNVESSAEIAREIANHLTEAICSKVPEARELIEQGWNAAYDVTREYYAGEFSMQKVASQPNIDLPTCPNCGCEQAEKIGAGVWEPELGVQELWYCPDCSMRFTDYD